MQSSFLQFSICLLIMVKIYGLEAYLSPPKFESSPCSRANLLYSILMYNSMHASSSNKSKSWLSLAITSLCFATSLANHIAYINTTRIHICGTILSVTELVGNIPMSINTTILCTTKIAEKKNISS